MSTSEGDIWVNYQRNRMEMVPPERRKQLDAISFEWNALADASWEECFAALELFKEREGHCRVARSHMEGELKLGNWVNTQRQATPSRERKKRLDDIGFVWRPEDSSWEEAFTALSRFKAREGHCRVPKSHMEGELKVNLGTWVIRQRKFVEALSVERKKRLDDIGFVWILRGTLRDSWWEEAFAALSAFKSREGHCRVPAGHMEGGLKLGIWVGNQRHQATPSAERKKRLDDIGFVWDPLQRSAGSDPVKDIVVSRKPTRRRS